MVRLWALNQKTIALREKMQEKTKKYWQAQYEDDSYYDGEDGGMMDTTATEEKKKTIQPSTRSKDSAMDRYKGELTKLERSMKAVQHQRYNARR